VGLFTKQVVQV